MATSILHPWIDQRLAPLYVVRLPPALDEAELGRYLSAVEELVLSHTSPYAFVNVPLTITASWRMRRMFANSELRTAAHDRQHCAGVAIVVTNSVTRGLFSAVYLMSKPVYPYRICPALPEAMGWASDQLQSRLKAR